MDSRFLKSFQYIVKFIEDLSTEFGNKQHSLVLYNRLIGKTKITHSDAIKRHVEAFHTFVNKNNQAILDKDVSKLKDPVILYSKKVNIRMDEIFKMADKETTEIIWKHLLVIMSNVDPTSEAMNVLKKSLEEKSSEGEFLSNLVQKLEKNVDPNVTDPMSAMMGMMSSGVLTDLFSSMNSGMQNGSLNIGKLLGTVQGMLSTLGDIPGMENPVETTTVSTTTITTTPTTTATISEVKED